MFLVTYIWYSATEECRAPYLFVRLIRLKLYRLKVSQKILSLLKNTPLLPPAKWGGIGLQYWGGAAVGEIEYCVSPAQPYRDI